jgi:hypothetical protein
MSLHIIGFTGFKSSGKDTLARYLRNKHAEKYADSVAIKLAFADVLKDICANMFVFNRDLCESEQGKQTIIEPYGKTVREILQWFGTSIGQNAVDKFVGRSMNLWINHVINQIYSIVERYGKHRNILITITDMRFINEYEHIKRVFPNLDVINVVRFSYSDAQIATMHISETEHLMIRVDNNHYICRGGGDEQYTIINAITNDIGYHL